MQTITDTGLAQPRESQVRRPKPKRFRLRNHEAWDRLRIPIKSMIGQYPGLQPHALTAFLSTEGYLDWLPRGAKAHGVVQRVLIRLERSGIVVQAGGWFLTDEATKDGIAEHGNQVARRGFKTATNAVDKVRIHGAISSMPKRTKEAAKSVEHLFV